jgi:peptide/nickel transport system permease protein
MLAIPLLLVTSWIMYTLARLAVDPFARGFPPPSPPLDPYFTWLANALHGDLGTSLTTRENVTDVLTPRIPLTVCLVLGTLVLSVVVGGALGIFSAIRGGFLGRAVDAFGIAGFAIPVFWLGAVLVDFIAVRLRLLPAIFEWPTSTSDWVKYFVLPVVTLSLGGIAIIARQTREAMLDVLGSEYVRMAWARGVPARSIVLRHALRPASLKVLTVLGVLAVNLLAGAVFVEIVFALPGLGTQLLVSAGKDDLQVVQAIAVLFALLIVLINLAIDLAYAWLDPRVEVE